MIMTIFLPVLQAITFHWTLTNVSQTRVLQPKKPK
jgi:hypothetical protein